jgi:hypothetical protein
VRQSPLLGNINLKDAFPRAGISRCGFSLAAKHVTQRSH